MTKSEIIVGRLTPRYGRLLLAVAGVAAILFWVLPATHGVEAVSKGTTTTGAAAKNVAVSSGNRPSVKITPECRKSLDKGTKWLLSAMRPDGCLGMDIGQPRDLACTSITGLALLSRGNTPDAGPNHLQLRRIMDAVLYMVERMPAGAIPKTADTQVQRKIGRRADLFLTALFLSQLLGESAEADEEVRRALDKLVAVICESQGKDGAWGDDSWAPVLGTVLGWESLRAASSSGLKVSASATLAGESLMKKLQTQNANNPGDWMHDFYKNASSIRVLYSLNYREEAAFKEACKRILKIAQTDHRPFQQAGGEEFLSFYLVTECMLPGQIENSDVWYPTVRDKLIRIQNADGSWTGHHCITARTFCTAAAVMTLSAPVHCLPISDL